MSLDSQSQMQRLISGTAGATARNWKCGIMNLPWRKIGPDGF